MNGKEKILSPPPLHQEGEIISEGGGQCSVRVTDGAVDGRLARYGGGSERAAIAGFMREQSVAK